MHGAQLDAMLCEEIEKAAEAFSLVGRCSRGQVLEAEARARAYRTLEAGKGSLGVGGGCYASGDVEGESGISLG